MGLLDNMPGLDTPQGQGLLSAAFSLMSAKKLPGQKGAFAGALGDAGQQYLQSSNASQDQMMKRKYLDAQMQAQQMQLEAARQAQAEKQRQEAAVRAAFAPMGASQAMAGGGGPTSANAARMGQMPQFDPLQLLRDGGMGALEQGLKVNSALNPAPKYTAYKPGDMIFKDGDMSKPAFAVPDKPEAAPSSVREFQYGQSNPAFNQWLLGQNSAKGTKVTVEGSKNIMTQESEQSKAYGKGMGDLRVEIQKAGFNAPSQLTKLARMEELLTGVDGGKLAPLGADIAGAARSLGLNIDPKLGNKQGAEALAVEMALAMKPPGSGTTSDKDFDNFMLTVPGLSKSAEGRKQITQTLRAKAQRDIQVSKMARAYASKNNGVLDDGFLDQVAEFVATNPVVAGGPPAGGGNVDALVNKYRSK